MVKEVRLYIEGGGNSADGRARLRGGFGQFFEGIVQRARKHNVRWRIIMCGPRAEAFKSFQQALRIHTDAFNILLVDSEGPVKGTPWAHLAAHQDQWQRPSDASDEACHLMVETAESWLLADPEALQRYYGKGFAVGSLPRTKNVESIPKATVTTALDAATHGTRKGGYHKIDHCSDLLGLVDPSRVRASAPHCARLFTVLEELLP